MRNPTLRMHAKGIRCRQPVNVQQKQPPTEWNCSEKIFVPVFSFLSSLYMVKILANKHTGNYKNSRRFVLVFVVNSIVQCLAFKVHRNATANQTMPIATIRCHYIPCWVVDVLIVTIYASEVKYISRVVPKLPAHQFDFILWAEI